MDKAFHLNEIAYDRNSVMTVGSFDGVHCAHQEIIHDVVVRARDRKGRSAVITFDPHPREVIGENTDAFRFLTTLEEREELCKAMGVDLFFVIAFDFEFSRQTSREFYLKYLVNGIGVSEVVEGYDHHFGRDREGGVESLLKLGKEFDFSIVAYKQVMVDGEIVSSSRIRDLLLKGRVEQAQRMLGRPYSLAGNVIRGDGRGKALGYPTANIRVVSSRKLIPGNGIYFVRVKVDGHQQYGMASIGVRPTFQTNGERIVEVNILNFDSDIYGRRIEFSFLRRLRDEIKFDSPDQLVQQMHKDKEDSLKLRSEYQRNT